jgi:hypothetical protein
MPPPIINDPTKELGYVAQRSGLFVVGKQSAEAVGESIAHGLKNSISAESFNTISTLGGAFSSSLATLATIGVAGAVSAALTEMDHIHRKENLKDMYKEELSTKLKKPIDTILRSDLNHLAETNSVIDEELARNRKQRNFGVALSLIASMASLAVITVAMPLVLPEAAIVAGGFLLKAAVGLASYHLVKNPLHAVADKLFNIDEKTTNDYIVNIKQDRAQGKIISREQVLSVFVSAHPEVDKYIVAQYGKHFDDLSVDDKKKATQELNNFIPLDKLTLEINAGKVNVSELAFAVEGQISGVNHEKFIPDAPKPGLVMSMISGVGHMLGIKTKHEHEKDHEFTVKAIAHATSSVLHGHGNHQANATAKVDAHKTHVEHLEQSRANDASMTMGSPT